jgi:hypothetical protein
VYGAGGLEVSKSQQGNSRHNRELEIGKTIIVVDFDPNRTSKQSVPAPVSLIPPWILEAFPFDRRPSLIIGSGIGWA